MYEAAGKISSTLVSTGFKPQAAFQAKALGLQDAQVAWVDHPISDNTVQALHAKAELAFPLMVEQLTTAGTRPLKNMEETAGPKNQEIQTNTGGILPAASALPIPAAAEGGG